MLTHATEGTDAAGWRLENSYAGLPASLFTRLGPVAVRAPRLVLFNAALARELGLEVTLLDSERGAALFAGNVLPPGSLPLAQAYAGHQYGHFTTLGDGRAILLGEQITPRGERYDIQLKGSGRTPYSRSGDGRAVLGPMLREYIISEAMHALGIPTTRSLAVVATGENVERETSLPGAVLTRVAASHIRVGTFQWAAAQRDPAVLRALANYTLARHDPELVEAPAPYFALLEAAIERQARLVARWLQVGFVHGVMNTDNMALSGETIDYGPCAFIEAYDPASTFSSIDRYGRYAYGNQPGIAQWNLARLAETLLPLLDADAGRALELANAALSGFEARFQSHWAEGMAAKLGLFTQEQEDPALIRALLQWMQSAQADYTNTFAELSSSAAQARAPYSEGPFLAWHASWKLRLARQPQTPAEVSAHMRAHNPALIPRNHRVEEALERALVGDLEPTRRLLAALARPFDHAAAPPELRSPADPDAPPYLTFCGT